MIPHDTEHIVIEFLLKQIDITAADWDRNITIQDYVFFVDLNIVFQVDDC